MKICFVFVSPEEGDPFVVAGCLRNAAEQALWVLDTLPVVVHAVFDELGAPVIAVIQFGHGLPSPLPPS